MSLLRFRNKTASAFFSAILLSAILLTGCTGKDEAAAEEITTATVNEAAGEYPLNSSADICLSELSFGMGRQETEAAIAAPLDEEMLNPYYSIYSNVSVDLDERLNAAELSYGESGLYQVSLFSGEQPENVSFELRDKLIEQLSGIYGFVPEDWDIENNGITNYCRNDDVSVYIRLFTLDGLGSVTLMITSVDHRDIKNVESKPVLL